MSIARLAIEKNRTTFAIVAFLLISGLLSFLNMPRAKDPSFAMRTALLVTPFPGATPDRVESLVTKPLEEKIRQLEEIKHTRCRSLGGVSIMRIDVKDKYSNVDEIWNKVRRKVKYVKLPEGTGKPEISEEYNEVYGTLISITGEGFNYRELEEIANSVKAEFLQIPDVGQIILLGLQKQRIYIEFSNAKLSEIGLSPSELAGILQRRNIITPGGEIKMGDRVLSIEPTGNLNSVEELKKTIIPLPGRDTVVYLEDIVDVKMGYAEPKDPMVRSNSRDAIVLGISLAKGGNIIKLGEDVKSKVNELLQKYPIGIEFETTFNEPQVVDNIIGSFISSLLQAIAIVSIIMLLTLGWRTGLIVATLIPSAILTSLFIMDNMSIGFDQVSLAALIIALGMLVDNAIVMSESISVKMQEGLTPMQAAIDSVNELKVSLLTSTITTAAAFLPIYLADSAASEYTASLFEVVSITLLSSWVLALTLTPLLSFMFLNVDSKTTFSYNNPLCNKFKEVLTHSLRYRYASISIVVVVFIMMMGAFTFVPRNFFPPSDQQSFVVKLNLPVGSPIENTLEAMRSLELLLEEQKDHLLNYTTFIGKGAPRFWINNSPGQKNSNYGDIIINTKSLDDVEYLSKVILDYSLAHFYDAKVVVQKLDNGPPQKQALQIRISGEDIEKDFDYAEKVIQQMQKIEGLSNVHDDWGTWTQKLIVDINPSLAYHAGVSYSDIARSLQIALTGTEVTEFRGKTETIPIVMRSSQTIKEDYDRLESTLIFVPRTGRSVPLRQVANIKMVWKPPRVIRRDGMHTITLTGDMSEGLNAFRVKELIQPYLESIDWDVGYHYEFGGAIENSKSSQEAIQHKLPIAAMIILMVLILQFNSIKKTTIILITIPLGIIGVVAGLLITNTSFGFMSYLGVISLTGIVINNAIILIERIEYELDVTKLSPQDAIIEATQRRLRPIVLTTMTTVGGLLPLWLGGGAMWQPMAIAIIFGLLFSTVLTLGVVPILYALFYKVKYPKGYRFIYGDSCVFDVTRGGTLKKTESKIELKEESEAELNEQSIKEPAIEKVSVNAFMGSKKEPHIDRVEETKSETPLTTTLKEQSSEKSEEPLSTISKLSLSAFLGSSKAEKSEESSLKEQELQKSKEEEQKRPHLVIEEDELDVDVDEFPDEDESEDENVDLERVRDLSRII